MSIISLRHVRSTEQIIWSHEPKGSTAAMVLFAVFGGQTCSSVIYFEMLKWTETLGWKWYLCHLWPWTGGDSYGLCFLFTNFTNAKDKLWMNLSDCGWWLWHIIDDGTKFTMPRHSMDLGLDYASLQWHHPGCEWSSSSAKDSYQRSLCKGEGQGFESMSKTVGIFQYHFGDRFWGACSKRGDRFWGACLKRGLCMVCVIFCWVVVSCLHKNARFQAILLWELVQRPEKIEEIRIEHRKWGRCLAINANNSSTGFHFQQGGFLSHPLFATVSTSQTFGLRHKSPSWPKNTGRLQWVNNSRRWTTPVVTG